MSNLLLVAMAGIEICVGTELVCGPPNGFLAPGGWLAESGLVMVPDAVGTEAALTLYGVDTDQASVMSADVRSDGRRERVHIQRVSLGNGRVTDAAEVGTAAACADMDTFDWNGGAGLRVHATALGTSDPSSPSVVLIDGNPRIGALVMLVPGDTVEIRETRRDGRLLRERLTVKHGEDVMEMRREGARRQQVCHGVRRDKLWYKEGPASAEQGEANGS